MQSLPPEQESPPRSQIHRRFGTADVHRQGRSETLQRLTPPLPWPAESGCIFRWLFFTTNQQGIIELRKRLILNVVPYLVPPILLAHVVEFHN